MKRPLMVGDMGLNEDPWALALVDEETIDAFPPIWDYHESIDDLKHRLLYATLELESLRTSAQQELKKKDEETRRKDLELKRKEEEMRRKDAEMQRKEEEMRRKDAEIKKKEEESVQLAQLFKITTQERDTLREELQMLLNKIAQKPQKEMLLTRGSSCSITESGGSPSETTHNSHHSYASSPVLEHLLETVTSPDILNMNMPASLNALVPLLPECNKKSIPGYDQSSWIINRLASKRPLPEKGKLLQAVQAVTRTTPLLETLLMTGSLPEWRNPPPLLPLHIPPANGGGGGGGGGGDQLLVVPSPTAVVRASSLFGWNNGKFQGGCYVPTESSSLCNNNNPIPKRQRIE